jgi:hypothetical protein
MRRVVVLGKSVPVSVALRRVSRGPLSAYLVEWIDSTYTCWVGIGDHEVRGQERRDPQKAICSAERKAREFLVRAMERLGAAS